MWSYTKTLFIQYLRMPYTYIAFLLPMIFIIGLGRIIPAGMIIPSAITVGVTITILFLFGGTLQEIRTTSFIKSVSLTKMSKTSIVLVNMFVASIISLISVFVIMLFSYGIDQTNYLATDFSAFFSSSSLILLLNASIYWGQIQWLTFSYGIVLTVVLTFSIAFLFISLTKSTNSLYVASFVYLFLVILAGGVVIPRILTLVTGSFVQYLNYWIPHYYTNQLLTSAMVVNNAFIQNFIEQSQYGETIQNIANAFPAFQDWNWDAINNDINTYNGLLKELNNGDYSGLKNTDWESNLFIYLTSPINELPYLGTLDKETIKTIYNFIDKNIYGLPPFLGAWVIIQKLSNQSLLYVLFFTGILSPDQFGSYIQLFYNESDVVIQYTKSVAAWDFTSLESMANSFLPIILSVIMVTIGVNNFKWSLR